MQSNQELSGKEQESTKEKKEGFFANLKKSGSKWIGIIFIATILGGVLGSGIGAIIGFAIFAAIGGIVQLIKIDAFKKFMHKVWNKVQLVWNKTKKPLLGLVSGVIVGTVIGLATGGVGLLIAPAVCGAVGLGIGVKQMNTEDEYNLEENAKLDPRKMQENISNEKSQTTSYNKDITQNNNVNTSVSNAITQHTDDLEKKITPHNYNQSFQENNPQHNKENYNKSFEGNLINFNNEMYFPNHQEVPPFNVNALYKMDNEPEEFIKNQQFDSVNAELYQDLDELEPEDYAESEPIKDFKKAEERERELKRKAELGR